MTTRTPRPRRLWLVAAPALALTLVVAGCSVAEEPAVTIDDAISATVEEDTDDAVVPAAVIDTADVTAAAVLAGDQETHDAEDDDEYDLDEATTIVLTGTSASITGDGAVDDGDTVRISDPGTYVLSGSYTGQVVVSSDADGQVHLVLDGVDIDTDAGAAIDVQAADEALVILAAGSTNTLSDTDTYAEDADANAALYSSADLTITGSGALTVTGNGNDGIASSDGLVIQSGTVIVDAVDDGIRGKDYLVVRGGDLTVTAGGDGLKADNEDDAERGYVHIEGGTVDVDAGDDGIDAFTDVVTTGGSVSITAGGGADGAVADPGAKGIVAGVIAVLAGGEIAVDASDDGIHADAYLHLAGADITVASGDDGVHADQELQVSAGDVLVTTSYEGLEAEIITISGGTSDITATEDGVNAAAAGGGASEPGSGSLSAQFIVTDGILIVDGGGEGTDDGAGDGIDINGSWTQTGGTIITSGPYGGGDGAVDADGTVSVDGGVLIALGGLTTELDLSAQSAVQFSTAGTAAGTTLTLTDDAGTELGTFTTDGATSITVSTADVTDGASYALVADGSTVATATAGDLTSTQGAGGGPGGGGAPGGAGGGPGGQRP